MCFRLILELLFTAIDPVTKEIISIHGDVVCSSTLHNFIIISEQNSVINGVLICKTVIKI